MSKSQILKNIKLTPGGAGSPKCYVTTDKVMKQVIECHPGKILEVLYKKEMWRVGSLLLDGYESDFKVTED